MYPTDGKSFQLRKLPQSIQQRGSQWEQPRREDYFLPCKYFFRESVSERGKDEQPTHYRRMREALKYSLPPPQREASFCMSFVRAYTYASDHRVVGGPRKKREGFLWPSIKCRGRKGRKERGGGTEPVINLCEAKRPFRQGGEGRLGGYKSSTQELVYGISMHFMP